ncbi:glycoside hydrolase family 28 protein [Fibrella aquatilis]|uniref:Right-handed parallel beta-helix repeat-containing protein n=1 Tax=Fibrella aquatilis TaxID=2817059 RepID=A0A939G9T8_9BACT|nr:glycosyl hydrolase family 28 protein [Fibrella aquatilis]MBO0933868.1 right-handed parallel beta-helix repeat-containing protein [Fibrella aquatilis]
MPLNRLFTWLLCSLSLPSIAQTTVYNVRNYGATGQKTDDATSAIAKAIDVARLAGGGVVQVPPGDYTCLHIALFSNITLQLDAGAVLYADLENPAVVDDRSFVYAENANNIAITGRGKIDGQAKYKWADYNYGDVEIVKEVEIAKKAGVEMKRSYRAGKGLFGVLLKECENVTVTDVTFENTSLWCMRIWGCNRVAIRGVTILSDLKMGVNSDGIDLDGTSNAHISGCTVSTGDDAICLKSGSWDYKDSGKSYPTENIIVDNCILTSSSTALMIGTETLSPIRHVLFSNCVIRHANKGIGINVQDGATVSDIKYVNLTIDLHRRHWNWWGDAEVFYFVLKKRNPNSLVGTIKNITIDNVTAHAEGTSRMITTVDKPLENIRLTNVQVFMEPEVTPDKRTTHAMRFEGVNGLTLDNVSVHWHDKTPEPGWQSGLVLTKVSNFRLRAVSARQAQKGSVEPAMLLTDCQRGIISECTAQPGTGRFMVIDGANTRDLMMHTNYLRNADDTALLLTKSVPKGQVIYMPLSK